MHLKCFRGSVLRVLQVLAVFRPLVLLALRVLAVPKYSQYAQHTRNMNYSSTVHRFDNFSLLFYRKHPQMAPRVGFWANYFRGGQLECLRVLEVFREHILRARALFSGSILCILSRTASISDVCTAGYCLHSGFCTAHAPSTRRIWAFSIAHTSNTRSI